ncbi:MAG: GNAT family N-acetyltransferase, partial [Nitrococcus sp.]|nr:GNAT family N-acetyltransferase [Nitrococcus sp.]
HLLIDITLAAHARRQGIGRGLIEQAQGEARQSGCGMRLHVRHDNVAAQRLYQRLGFVTTEGEGAYLAMCWPG